MGAAQRTMSTDISATVARRKTLPFSRGCMPSVNAAGCNRPVLPFLLHVLVFHDSFSALHSLLGRRTSTSTSMPGGSPTCPGLCSVTAASSSSRVQTSSSSPRRIWIFRSVYSRIRPCVHVWVLECVLLKRAAGVLETANRRRLGVGGRGKVEVETQRE